MKIRGRGIPLSGRDTQNDSSPLGTKDFPNLLFCASRRIHTLPWFALSWSLTVLFRFSLKVRQVLHLAEDATCVWIPYANDVKLKVLATTFSSVNAKRQRTAGRCGRGAGPQHLTTRTSPTNCVYMVDSSMEEVHVSAAIRMHCPFLAVSVPLWACSFSGPIM